VSDFTLTAHLYLKVDVSKEHICNNQSGELGGFYIFQLAKRYVNLNIRNCTLYISYNKWGDSQKWDFQFAKMQKMSIRKNIKKEQN
jgi:hypothetical protein